MTDEKARSVKYWTDDERPRKRLIAYSNTSLSNAQLLAIKIKKSKAGRSTLDLAMALLVKFNFWDNGMIGCMP